MSAVADFIPNDVTNLRDVIDVPVPVIDVGDSSLRVPSLLSDEPTLELSGILSTLVVVCWDIKKLLVVLIKVSTLT